MFDVWDWWEPNYGAPVENGSTGGGGFNIQETINRMLDVIGGRYSPGYVSPDNPQYGQQYPYGGSGSYPYGNDQYGGATTIGGGGGLTLTPLTIGIGLFVLFMVLKKK